MWGEMAVFCCCASVRMKCGGHHTTAAGAATSQGSTRGKRTILKFSSRGSISCPLRNPRRGGSSCWPRGKKSPQIDLRDRLPHRQPAAARHVQRPREARVRDRSEEADAGRRRRLKIVSKDECRPAGRHSSFDTILRRRRRPASASSDRSRTRASRGRCTWRAAAGWRCGRRSRRSI